MIQSVSHIRRRFATATAFVTVTLLTAPAAHASGSSMPWEQPLQQILQSIEGPVSKFCSRRPSPPSRTHSLS